MQTTATAAATQEPPHACKVLGIFTHTPRPPLVPSEPEYACQRRYQPKSEFETNDHVRPSEKDARSMRAEIEVYRDGNTDLAALNTRMGLWTSATMSIRLNPAELRDLAERLIDAAYDIEANPAKALARAAATANAQAAA